MRRGATEDASAWCNNFFDEVKAAAQAYNRDGKPLFSGFPQTDRDAVAMCEEFGRAEKHTRESTHRMMHLFNVLRDGVPGELLPTRRQETNKNVNRLLKVLSPDLNVYICPCTKHAWMGFEVSAVCPCCKAARVVAGKDTAVRRFVVHCLRTQLLHFFGDPDLAKHAADHVGERSTDGKGQIRVGHENVEGN